MRAIAFAILGVSGLALSACMPSVHVDSVEALRVDKEPLKAVAQLDCPVEEGRFVLTGRDASGQSCDYRRDDGELVTLKRVALDGRPAAEALAPLRAELQGLIPVKSTPIAPISDDETPHNKVDMPFLHVKESGGRSDVSILGFHIRSDGDRADVDVSKGQRHTVVHASAHGAEVIVDEVGRQNVSYVYVLTHNHRPPSGYEAVGYLAKGPVTGPLVVAEFKAPRDHDGMDRGDHIDHGDVGRLIDRNVKG
jgi:hypothetical protein